jgi:hypothetical protein
LTSNPGSLLLVKQRAFDKEGAVAFHDALLGV